MSSAWTDWGVPVLLLAASLVEIAVVRPTGAVYAAALAAAACLALVPRRRRPLTSGLAAAALFLAVPWFGPELNDLAAGLFVIFVAAYAVARWRGDHAGVLVLAGVALIALAAYVGTDERANDITDVFFMAALLLPPYVLGRVTRRLAEQAAELSAHQELVAHQAARDERDRIARELHDVLAHSLSAMVVQTAAARDLVRRDPDRVAAILDDVAEAGRQALAETGRLLHLVRDDQDELGMRPAPGLADVPELVAAVRSRGLEVSYDTAPPDRPLPGGIDVSTYRIAQEALTNALRYGTGTADLAIRCDPREVVVRAGNPVRPQSDPGSGLGLLGIAERVAMCGGSVSHAVTDGRFELVARLPLAPEPTS